jgi:hypothetical protein
VNITESSATRSTTSAREATTGEWLTRTACDGAGISRHSSSVRSRSWGRFESGERRWDGVEFGAVAKAMKVDYMELFTRFVWS